jgi:beta-glucosidase/6-phospho-beta-glucosidase/beta-galactosidase
MDYYANNERYICPDGEQAPCGPALGWHAIGTAYFRRYHKPMMLTETNCLDPEQASKWLWTTWQSVQSLRDEGVPVLGYTWYSLTDQIDWDIQLREIKGHVNGNGLYTLERRARPVAQAFRAVAQRYGSETVLPES